MCTRESDCQIEELVEIMSIFPVRKARAPPSRGSVWNFSTAFFGTPLTCLLHKKPPWMTSKICSADGGGRDVLKKMFSF